MKYIIEIEDEPIADGNGTTLYKAKGFNSLVFDNNGLDKLTPYDPDKEQEEKFMVGDEVMGEDGRGAYVLVPGSTDHNGRQTTCVLLMEGYVHPQLSLKHRWKKTGYHSDSIVEFVKQAYERLNEEDAAKQKEI